ncbi:MAG: glycosyltransferase family 4 protein [Patescibacteria group bacterium]|nr:glycosyltransferase family 4 protein [Patescibacteria group bacterium]
MKILQINKFFDLRGGAEVYMHELSRRLTERGHEVHTFSTKSPKNLQSADRDYFVHRYNYDRKEGMSKDAKKAINFIWNKEAKQSLDSQLTDLKPDVIHLHNIYHHLSSSILSVIRKHKIPCVQTLHDYKLACPNYKMYTQGKVCERCKGGKYYNAILHKCLFPGLAPNILAATEMSLTKITHSYERTVKTFICPSKFMMEKMVDWGEPPGKLAYLPNPVEIPSQTSPQRGHGNYVFIGRLYPEKGIETLIRAVARVPSAKLNIVGEGPDRNRLEVLANQIAQGRINFLGFQTGEELNRIRREAKALCIPSVWYENAPLTALEAMAEGIPLIASSIGGLPELITDGVSGFLAKPDSIESWIEALSQMETFTGEQRAELGDYGRDQAVKYFGWESHLEALEKIYIV